MNIVWIITDPEADIQGIKGGRTDPVMAVKAAMDKAGAIGKDGKGMGSMKWHLLFSRRKS